jgi:hypothetical protein
MVKDHKRIWLEPVDDQFPSHPREWCDADVWEGGIEYIRADLASKPTFGYWIDDQHYIPVPDFTEPPAPGKGDAAFESICGAYKRGAMWYRENGSIEGLGKAAYDYADKAAPPADDGKDAEIARLKEEIGRLHSLVDRHRDFRDEAEDEADVAIVRAMMAEALIRDLVATLKPFAQEADEYFDEASDDCFLTDSINLRDVRAARAALTRADEAGYGEERPHE